MKQNNIITLIALVAVYLLLKHIIPYGGYVVYPVNLLVTFLHEFGHSAGSLLTGGSVKSIEINADGSGVATTAGGVRAIVLMGGYIGSAILGNMLLYIGSKKKKWSEFTIYFLAGLMIFSAIFWFNSFFSSILLLLIAGGFILLAKKSKFDSVILQFLGLASIIHIIEDFNVGPSSDLSKFSEIFVILPQSVWMYAWLIIVLIITGLNIRFIFKK